MFDLDEISHYKVGTTVKLTNMTRGTSGESGAAPTPPIRFDITFVNSPNRPTLDLNEAQISCWRRR
ncbi:hypothetical protein [Streptomyces sp. NPDC048248]|uniref:hypothetical protein n=1 Tax=Streptomyces sp. NPDC048248 TaxID=3365523 RepID=UPI00371C45AA